ncbi:hypothetical protein GCM10020367_64110 [Streptomyces sannanensis]|uniref:Uncharacterized protein n=1 Tax=Streptomyces sannanensis TaxID=285536 RepID=A0ABP6S4H8_9ACTN
MPRARAASATARRPARLRGLLPGKLAVLVGLLCLLGVLGTLALGPGASTATASGDRTAAAEILSHGTDADDLCTADCGTSPRVFRATLDERVASHPVGVSIAVGSVFFRPPCQRPPPPAPDTAAQPQHTACHTGRAPPPSAGIRRPPDS